MRLYTKARFFTIIRRAFAETRSTRLASASCLYLRRRTTRKTLKRELCEKGSRTRPDPQDLVHSVIRPIYTSGCL